MVPMLCNGVIVLHVFYGVIESIKFILNITVGGLFYILVLWVHDQNKNLTNHILFDLF